MAYSPSLAKKWYENLSVEELESKYEELKRNYYFETKEEQIGYIIKNYLNASKDVNNRSTKIALEELLKEKTGREYKIEPKTFEISSLDIINFITNLSDNPSLNTTLINFFSKLNNISESKKIHFLIGIVQDRNTFNEFSKEILQENDANTIFSKYQKIVQDYVSKNSMIG